MFGGKKSFISTLLVVAAFVATSTPNLFAQTGSNLTDTYLTLVCDSNLLSEIEPYVFVERRIHSGIIPPHEVNAKRSEVKKSWQSLEKKHQDFLTKLGLLKGTQHPMKISDLDAKEFSLHIKTAMKIRMKKCIPEKDRAKWKLSDLSSAVYYLMDHFGR